MKLTKKDKSRLEKIQWKNPTLRDLAYLQELHNREIDKIFPYFDLYNKEGVRKPSLLRRSRLKNFRFYDEGMEKIPTFEKITIGKPTPLKRCIVLYASVNGPWKTSMLDLISKLKKQGYRGDVLYQIGGWPYIKGGGLKAFFTPYAFKPCALMEVMQDKSFVHLL